MEEMYGPRSYLKNNMEDVIMLAVALQDLKFRASMQLWEQFEAWKQ